MYTVILQTTSVMSWHCPAARFQKKAYVSVVSHRATYNLKLSTVMCPFLGSIVSEYGSPEGIWLLVFKSYVVLCDRALSLTPFLQDEHEDSMNHVNQSRLPKGFLLKLICKTTVYVCRYLTRTSVNRAIHCCIWTHMIVVECCRTCHSMAE